MTGRTSHLPDDLYSYLLAHSVRESDVMRRLREETARLEHSDRQIGPEQGRFMALLVELIGAENALEVGTFTGYSALAVADALPEHGRLVACDVSVEWTSIARRYWAEAGVDHKIDLRLAPATETLDALLADGGENQFDFAFVDADKEAYEAYYERTLRLVRPGGLIAVDNTLWEGKVVDASVTDADTEAIRRFNRNLIGDERISLSIVPIGDGLSLARVR